MAQEKESGDFRVLRRIAGLLRVIAMLQFAYYAFVVFAIVASILNRNQVDASGLRLDPVGIGFMIIFYVLSKLIPIILEMHRYLFWIGTHLTNLEKSNRPQSEQLRHVNER